MFWQTRLFKHPVLDVLHIVLLVGFPVLRLNDLSFFCWSIAANAAYEAGELQLLLVSLLLGRKQFLRVIGQRS